MDILTLGLAGGVAGAAAGKFIEKAWDSGEKWINSYFLDHRPQAIEKAKENSKDFLNKLAVKIDRLEQDAELNKNIFEQALNEPSFGALLQKALIGSAQTESTQKHDLLATLVAQKIGSQPDSLYAVASQLACDAIIHCTNRQLLILAFVISLTGIRPQWLKQDIQNNEMFYGACKNWFDNRFAPYKNIQVNHMDLLHLESLSCLSFLTFVSNDINNVITKNWKSGLFTLKKEELLTFDVGPTIQRLWETDKLQSVKLTTIGQLIGVLTSDQISGSSPTSFDEWQKI
jgi:hypothetical protein